MKFLATIFFLSVSTLACDAQHTTKRAKGRVNTATVQPLPTLSINNVSGSEGSGALVWTVTKSGNTAQTVSFNYATEAGTAGSNDYTGASGTVEIGPTVYAVTIRIEIADDTLDEETESFNLNLSGAVNATISDAQGVGTILDNDTTIVLPDPDPDPPACTYVIVADDYGVSSANTNNYTALNTMYRYIETLPRYACKTVIMPAGADIRVATVGLRPPQTDSLIWEGNNSNIRATYTVASADYNTTSTSVYTKYMLMRHSAPVLFSAQPVMAAIDSNATTLTISQTNAVKIKAGDLLYINTSKADPYNTRGRQGGVKVVQSVNASTGVVTVTTPFVHTGQLLTTQALTVTAYRPSNAWLVKNQKWELFPGSLGTCAYFDQMTNSRFENCYLDGKAVMRGELRGFAPRTKDSYIGLGVYGHNNTVYNVESKNFWDNDGAYGYAVSLYGENLIVRKSIFRHAKHGVTVGYNPAYSVNILVDSNYTVDAMLEAHEDTKYATFKDNNVTEVGLSTYPHGIYARAYYSQILNNTITGAATTFPAGSTTAGVYVMTQGGSIGYKINNNTIIGMRQGIFSDAAQDYNFEIKDNYISSSTSAITLKNGVNGTISGNEVYAGANALYIEGGRNLTVNLNELNYGSLAFGGGVFFATGTGSGNSVTNNTITSGNYGTNPIRVQNGYNSLTLTNNVLTWPGSRFTLANSIRIDECTTCNCLNIFSNTGSSLNITCN